MSWGRRYGVVLAVAVVTSVLTGTAAAVEATQEPRSADLAGTGIQTVRTEVASADTSGDDLVAARSVVDPRDSESGVDIREILTERLRDGRTRFRINTENTFKRENAPCLSIQGGLKRIGYRICGSGAVVRVASRSRVGKASVGRPTKRSIVYTFGNKAVGSVSFYRWRGVVYAKRCSRGVCDRSPNSGWITHKRKVTYGKWAASFLRELKAPRCQNNKVVVIAWLVNEGTSAVWNPLATTYTMPGNTVYNSHGVKNYPGLAVGLNASRLTLERGWDVYRYGEIVRRLRHCRAPKETARAIKRSSWCFGCTGGRYVIGLIGTVKSDYRAYARRDVATAL